jgi:hypothetical protein
MWDCNETKGARASSTEQPHVLRLQADKRDAPGMQHLKKQLKKGMILDKKLKTVWIFSHIKEGMYRNEYMQTRKPSKKAAAWGWFKVTDARTILPRVTSTAHEGKMDEANRGLWQISAAF